VLVRGTGPGVAAEDSDEVRSAAAIVSLAMLHCHYGCKYLSV
jgi:hypothetical protein